MKRGKGRRTADERDLEYAQEKLETSKDMRITPEEEVT